MIVAPRSGQSSRRRQRAQRGQIMVFFAFAAVVVLGMVALAVDGGYGLVQYRRAQNAADFGSVGGASALRGICQGSGNPPSDHAVYKVVDDIIIHNAGAQNLSWSGVYIDASKKVINNGQGQPYMVNNNPGSVPPPTACGVRLTVKPSWPPFVAQILGASSLSTNASASAALIPTQGKAVAIVALDEVAPHEVLGGGQGSFNVYGTIFANSSVPYGPWNENRNGTTYVDVVDAKDTSTLTLHGTMATVTGNWPLDWCYGVKPDGTDSGNLYNSQPGPNQPPCNPNSSTSVKNLTYDFIANNQPQISDPLLPANGSGVPDPFDTSGNGGYYKGLCPNQSTPTKFTTAPNPSPPPNSTTVLQPGEYTKPVVIVSGNVQFADCSGAFNPKPNDTTTYPGVFRFDAGLLLLTAGTVQGNNVMVATGAPVPLPGNVPGSVQGGVFVASGPGNGAPCFPDNVYADTGNRNPETDATHACGGTDASAPAPFNAFFPNGPYHGVISRNQSSFQPDPNGYGTGTNFSLILGGSGSVTLNPPATGLYRDIGLFQQRTQPANFGLDAEPGDAAAITIAGVVYNTSLPCLGFPVVNGSCTNNSTKPATNPFDYWDQGTPAHPGGVLQAGIGIGYGYPRPSSGSVTINGPTVVDDFDTDGNTSILIDGTKNTYNLPGVLGSGNPPIVG